jgi:hypothetical protein
MLPTCLGGIQGPTGEHQALHGISPATPRINQHSPLGRLTAYPTNSPPKKNPKNWTINKELKTSTQQRAEVAESALLQGGEQGAHLCENFQ